METHRLNNEVADSDLNKLQGGGDNPSMGLQFKHPEHLQHALDFQPGDSRSSSSSHSRAVFSFGQSRRVGAAQSVYPGQGGAYSTRHFPRYKPGQPLPAVGEEEVEKTQLRSSPLPEDTTLADSFFNEERTASPLRDSFNSSRVTQNSSTSPSLCDSPIIREESGNFSILNNAVRADGLSHSDPANLARNSNGT